VALVRVYCGLASADLNAAPPGSVTWLTFAVVDDAGRLLDICDISDDAAGYAELGALLADRSNGLESVAVAADSDDHVVTQLLTAAGRYLAYTDDDSADDYAARFADDASVDEIQSSPAERRAIGLARALQAGVLSAVAQATPRDLLGLKPVLAAHAAVTTGRQGAAATLREVLRELYPAALRAFPDPAEPTPLAILDALPEPGPLGNNANGRGRDAQAIAELAEAGVADATTITEAVAALRVAIAETPRRTGMNRSITSAVAETVRQAVAAVRACDNASGALVSVLAARMPSAGAAAGRSAARARGAGAAATASQPATTASQPGAAASQPSNGLRTASPGEEPARPAASRRSRSQSAAVRPRSAPPAVRPQSAPPAPAPAAGAHRATGSATGAQPTTYGKPAVPAEAPAVHAPAPPAQAPAQPAAAAAARSQPAAQAPVHAQPPAPAPVAVHTAPAPPIPVHTAPAPPVPLQAPPAPIPVPPPAAIPTPVNPAPPARPQQVAPAAAATTPAGPPPGLVPAYMSAPPADPQAAQAAQTALIPPVPSEPRYTPAASSTSRTYPSVSATGGELPPSMAPGPVPADPPTLARSATPVVPTPSPVPPISAPPTAPPPPSFRGTGDLERYASSLNGYANGSGSRSAAESRPGPDTPPPGSRASWPLSNDATRNSDQARTPEPRTYASSEAASNELPRQREGRVVPPWQSDDLPAEPPALRLVEPAPLADPALSGERPVYRNELDGELRFEPPALRLVESSTGDRPTLAPPGRPAETANGDRMPRRAARREEAEPPPAQTGEESDGDLLIFAEARSAWFTDHFGEEDAKLEWANPSDEGWVAASRVAEPAVGAETGSGLPRRVPQQNLVPGSPSPEAPERPLRIVRDAAAIAAHTTGYFRGWRRGQEVGGYKVGGRPGRESAGGWDFSRDQGGEHDYEYREARR
jgi:hypothetical protein